MNKSTGFIIVALFLSICISSVAAGRIYPWGEPIINFPNKDQISTITLFFTLDSALKNGNYMRITFPYSNNPITTASTVKWVALTTNSRGIDPPADATLTNAGTVVYATTAAPNQAIVSFGADLSAGINYAVKLSVMNLPTDSAGFLGYIKLETLSPAVSVSTGSGSDLPIIYDSNTYFAPVHLFPAASAPSTFAINGTDANKGNAGYTWIASIYVKPNADVWPRPSIKITWTGGYTLAGCLSYDTGATTTPTALAASQYTCTVTTATTLVINQNVPLLHNQTAVYRVNITNPATTSSTTFNFWIYHRFNYNNSDYITAASQISSTATASTTTTTTTTSSTTATPPTISSVKILLSWGIDRGTDVGVSGSALDKIFRIYSSTPKTGYSGAKWYQALRFAFRTSTQLSGTFTVRVNLGTLNTVDVLENSIYNNLPGSAVSCFYDLTDTTYTYITCTGVTSLNSGSDNIVGARIWIPNSLVTSNAITGTFGAVSAAGTYTLAAVSPASTYLSANSLGGASNAEITLNFNGNGPLVAYPNSVDSYVRVSTSVDYGTHTTTGIQAVLGGVVGSTTSVAYTIGLITTITLVAGTGGTGTGGVNAFTADTSSTAGILATKSGIDLYLNPNLWNAPTTSQLSGCAIQNSLAAPASGLTNAMLHCQSVTYSLSSVAKWLRLRAIYIDPTGANTPAATTYNTAASGATPTYMTFLFGAGASPNTITNVAYSGASLLANNYVGDHYAALYITTASPAVYNSGSPVADLGELGSTNIAATVNTPFFFTTHIVAPYSIATGPAATFPWANIESFVTGYSGSSDTTNKPTDTQIAIYNVRGYFSGSDPTPSTNSYRLLVFFDADQVFLAPAGSTAATLTGSPYTAVDSAMITGSTISCGSGTGSKQNCQVVRRSRARGTSETAAPYTQNNLDLYAVISSDISYTSATSAATLFRAYFVLKSAVAPTNKIRIGLQSSSLNVWIAGNEISIVTTNNYAGTAAGADSSATAAIVFSPTSTTAACINNGVAGTTQPYIRLTPSLTTDAINTNLAASNIAYALSAADGTVSVSAGKRGGIFYCAAYNWQGTGFTVTAASLTSSVELCWAFNYKPAGSATSKDTYCIFCPYVSAAPTTTSANIALTNVKANINQDIQVQTFASITSEQGRHTNGQQCPYTQYVFASGNATFTTTSGTYYGLNGQKVVLNFGLPNGITNADKIQVTGYAVATTLPLTSTSSADSNFPYFNNPDSTVICKFGTTTAANSNPSALGSCTAVVSGGTLTINAWNVPSATDQASSAFTTILWGVVGFAAAAGNPTTSNVVAKSSKTSAALSLAGLIDQSSLSTPATWSYTNATTSDFPITNTLLQRNYFGSKGFIKWDFTLSNSRPLFQQDTIVFKLDSFSSTSNNVQSALKCRVTDSSDNLLQLFKECTFATGSPNTITIRPAPAILWELPNAVWRVYIENVVITALSTSKGIYGSATYSTLANPIQARASPNVDLAPASLATTTAFPTGLPTLTKVYNQYGDLQDLSFNLSTSVALTDAGKIVVVFPSYYQGGLNRGWGSPYCTIQAIAVQCQVIRETQLIVTGPAPALAAAANFTLKVQGVPSSLPVTGNSLEPFYIFINSDNTDNSATVVYAGTVTDVAGSATAVALTHVNQAQVSLTDVRALDTFTWSFTVTADVDTTKTLQIVFPNVWGLTSSVFTPSCKVYDWSDTTKTPLSGTQTISGPYVVLPISTLLSHNALLNIDCANIRNIDNPGTYLPTDIQIRIIDSSNNVFAHSVMSAHNTDFTIAFSVHTGFIATSFTGLSNIQSAPTVLLRGQYSGLNSFVTGEIPSRAFTLAVTGSNWAILPAQVNISIGQPTNTMFSLGVATSVPLGVYGVIFTHTDTTRYAQPPVAWIQVNSGGSAITRTPSGDVGAIVGSSTVPVVFDASANPPYSDVSITVVLDPTTNVFTVSPASISLTTLVPFASFVFKTTSAAVAGNSTKVTYTLGGTNVNSYTVPIGHNLPVSADTSGQTGAVPTLTSYDKTADVKKATTKIFYINLAVTTTATIYWCAATPGQGFTITQLWTQGANRTQLNMANPIQLQCGFYVQAKGEQAYTITGLKPNTAYEISAFANSIFNQNSTITIFDFQTNSNGGSLTRVLFQFTSYPTTSVRQTLLCALSQQLTAPYMNVISIHGDFCNGGTAFYQQTNTSNGLGIYFYPSNTEVDTITIGLNTNLNTISTALNTTLGATAGWLSYALDGTIAPYAPGAITGSVATTTNSFTISGVTLNQSGYVFIGYEASATANTPTGLQLKMGVNSAGAALASTYNNYITAGQAVSQTFSNLNQNTTYQVYAVASNGDPSQLAVFTPVVAVAGTTSAPATNQTTTNAIALFSSVVLALICTLTSMI